VSTQKLSTIILRFRDLVTEHGQTIQRHQEIANGGYVWWGWWRKRDETIAGDAFRNLARRAQAGGFEIYLMDSGQELLYRATCTEIRWDATYIKIKSPDITKTPEYYSTQTYLAWFQLKGITQVADPEVKLHKFTYLQVDEFFEHGKSSYTPFYGKRVYSVKELRQQDRTIWFLKDFENGEPTHEVSLLSSRSVAPVHFSTEYFESASRSLLWVSDVHFSGEGHHAFPLKPTHDTFDLAQRVVQNFGKPGPNNEDTLDVAGVIISGDVTWRALPQEFEMAKEFLKKLSFSTPLQSDQIAVCPGNHDLEFSTDPADKVKPITIVGEGPRAAYSQFYEDLFYLRPNEFLSCGKRLLLGKAVPVDIVCLNSSWLQQLKDAFQGHGFIGQLQMKDAAKQMGWDVDSNAPHAYRIVVIHHHILPTTYSAAAESNYQYSVVLDAEALSRWVVEHRVGLVLHGHMHQPFCARVSRPLDVNNPQGGFHDFHVLGMGSSGVKGELGEINTNTVGFLRFEKDVVNVSVHSIHPTDPSVFKWSVDVPLKPK
jgi:Calcineurin-like phosphoesterase